MRPIINCDMGEGTGNDALLMPWIQAANIACGYHAGDEDTMKRTVALAIEHQVAIGAHPSFPGKENFGRTSMQLAPAQVYDLVTAQIFALQKITNEAGTILHHVKPHGALYNMAAKDETLAAIIAKAVKDTDPLLVLYGLSGSCAITIAKENGLHTASEVFADRTYQDDGSLTPRTQPGALVTTAGEALLQVLQMVNKGTVTTLSGKIIPLVAETICIHGDGPQAVEFAKTIYSALNNE